MLSTLVEHAMQHSSADSPVMLNIQAIDWPFGPGTSVPLPEAGSSQSWRTMFQPKEDIIQVVRPAVPEARVKVHVEIGSSVDLSEFGGCMRTAAASLHRALSAWDPTVTSKSPTTDGLCEITQLNLALANAIVEHGHKSTISINISAVQGRPWQTISFDVMFSVRDAPHPLGNFDDDDDSDASIDVSFV
jgi:hypothetical protein